MVITYSIIPYKLKEGDTEETILKRISYVKVLSFPKVYQRIRASNNGNNEERDV